MKNITCIACGILPLTLLLSACQLIGTIYNIGDKAVNILLDDRPLAQDGKDLATNAAVRQALIAQNAKFGLDIEVTVFNNVVLLTGALPSPALIEQATTAAWSVADVTQVINYIRLAEPSSLLAGEDASISAKIRTQLSLTRGISSANYKLTMDNGVVYLMGFTRDDAELERVLSVIKSTPGVSKVLILMEPLGRDR